MKKVFYVALLVLAGTAFLLVSLAVVSTAYNRATSLGHCAFALFVLWFIRDQYLCNKIENLELIIKYKIKED